MLKKAFCPIILTSLLVCGLSTPAWCASKKIAVELAPGVGYNATQEHALIWGQGRLAYRLLPQFELGTTFRVRQKYKPVFTSSSETDRKLTTHLTVNGRWYPFGEVNHWEPFASAYLGFDPAQTDYYGPEIGLSVGSLWHLNDTFSLVGEVEYNLYLYQDISPSIGLRMSF